MNIIEVAIEPKTENGRAGLADALDWLRQSWPSIGIRLDTESGQTILSGSGEDELEEAVSALVSAHHIDLRVGALAVVCRETLSKRVTILHTHKKHIGGAGEFAEVKIEFGPLPPGSGVVFDNDIVGGSVPKEFIPAVEKGVRSEAETGLLVGFPVVDIQARLVDGKYHEADSSPLAFEIAARAAFRELAAKGGVRLLEPIMNVEVVAPDDYLGSVIGDLNARRAHIQSVSPRGNGHAISAMVPMSNMLGYSNALRAATDGHGQYTIVYDHHEVVPGGNDDDPRFPGAAAMRVA